MIRENQEPSVHQVHQHLDMVAQLLEALANRPPAPGMEEEDSVRSLRKRFGEAISDFCIALSDNEEATVGERQPRETHDAYPYVVVSGMELIEVLDAVQHHGESLTSAKNALTLQHAAHTTAVLASVARARADMHMARDVRYSVIPVLTRDEFTATSHHELEMILRSQTKVPSMLALQSSGKSIGEALAGARDALLHAFHIFQAHDFSADQEIPSVQAEVAAHTDTIRSAQIVEVHAVHSIEILRERTASLLEEQEGLRRQLEHTQQLSGVSFAHRTKTLHLGDAPLPLWSDNFQRTLRGGDARSGDAGERSIGREMKEKVSSELFIRAAISGFHKRCEIATTTKRGTLVTARISSR